MRVVSVARRIGARKLNDPADAPVAWVSRRYQRIAIAPDDLDITEFPVVWQHPVPAVAEGGDRLGRQRVSNAHREQVGWQQLMVEAGRTHRFQSCLLYTSDAADE